MRTLAGHRSWNRNDKSAASPSVVRKETLEEDYYAEVKLEASEENEEVYQSR